MTFIEKTLKSSIVSCTESLYFSTFHFLQKNQFYLRDNHIIITPVIVNPNLVQYLLQTDIQKRTEKIQWQIQTLHRDFSPGVIHIFGHWDDVMIVS